jgi:hypothetical protein
MPMTQPFPTADYAVVEKPTLETWMQGGLDYIVLRDLSIDGIRTIGSVLGQSIALDYYIRQVRIIQKKRCCDDTSRNLINYLCS